MSDEPVATSFDALAYEHNLSNRMRDLCRIFFLAGLRKGRVQADAINTRKSPEPRDSRAEGRS